MFSLVRLNRYIGALNVFLRARSNKINRKLNLIEKQIE